MRDCGVNEEIIVIGVCEGQKQELLITLTTYINCQHF